MTFRYDFGIDRTVVMFLTFVSVMKLKTFQLGSIDESVVGVCHMLCNSKFLPYDTLKLDIIN